MKLSEEEILELAVNAVRAHGHARIYAAEHAVGAALRLQRERIAERLRTLHSPRRCGETCDCLHDFANELERESDG